MTLTQRILFNIAAALVYVFILLPVYAGIILVDLVYPIKKKIGSS